MTTVSRGEYFSAFESRLASTRAIAAASALTWNRGTPAAPARWTTRSPRPNEIFRGLAAEHVQVTAFQVKGDTIGVESCHIHQIAHHAIHLVNAALDTCRQIGCAGLALAPHKLRQHLDGRERCFEVM